MQHYEIVLLIHPDQSGQVTAMVDRYKDLIKKGGGKVHRFEDWGRRALAYTIKKVHKAHYILLNIECSQAVLDELTHAFKYNDAVLRNLVLQCKEAIKTASPMMKEVEKEKSSARVNKKPVEEYVE